MDTHAIDDREQSTGRQPMSLDEIRASYADRADWFDRLDWLDRALTSRYRRRLFGTADGLVLDVACGTGINFPYLPPTAEVVGVDISPEMLAKASARLDDLDVDGRVMEMDAQDLDFPDDSFDTVISSLSTCTFPEPVAAVGEMSRVCKPDGRILLFEHGKSDVGPIARLQDRIIGPYYERTACRWNQEPVEHVLAANLAIENVSTHALGILTLIEAKPAQETIVDAIRARLDVGVR